MNQLKSQKIDVAIIQRRLASYRLPLYERIIKSNPNITLTVYCGHPDNSNGISGLPFDGKDPFYIKRVTNYPIKLFGRTFLVQPFTIFDVLRQGYDVIVYEGSLILLSSFIVLGLRRLIGAKNILWLKGWPNSHLDGIVKRTSKYFFLKLAQSYIGYGEASKNSLKSYGLPKRKITIAQNTIDTDYLLEKKDGKYETRIDSPLVKPILEKGSPYIFYLGRHVPKKRVADLLIAFAIVKKDPSADDVELVIAGAGPENERLKRLARDLKLKQVSFVGSISDNDANQLFIRSTCCVFPGAVGLALNQAMAWGKPIICADEMGPDTEIIRHEINGIRYERGNIEQLVEYLKRIVVDEELQQKLGLGAYQSFKQDATMEKMVENYVSALYLALEKDTK